MSHEESLSLEASQRGLGGRVARLSFEYIVKVSWLLLSRCSFQDFSSLSLDYGGLEKREFSPIFAGKCHHGMI